MSKIFYWEKQAARIEEEEEDKLIEDYSLTDRHSIREVIRNLENYDFHFFYCLLTSIINSYIYTFTILNLN